MRVLVSGYYGFGNVGDEAVLAGLLVGLRGRAILPLVLSGDPAGTRALHGVPSAHRSRDLLWALLRSDALVSGGGGLLQDATSRRSLSYYLGVVRLARVLGKPVVVYGQSVGPLTRAGRRRVAAALRGLPLAVRDRQSQGLLAELGLASTLVADPALLLPRPAARNAARRPAQARPVLLIPRAGHDDLNQALLDAGRRIRAGGRSLAVLGLHEHQDGPAVARLAGALEVEPWRATTPQEALGQVAGAGYVVSVRLHGLIFAAVCGIGFAGLVYDPKVAGFLDEARAPAFTRPVDAARLAAAALAGAAPEAGEDGTRLRDLALEGVEWLADHLPAPR